MGKKHVYFFNIFNKFRNSDPR